MSHVVIFAGPVMLKPDFQKIDWLGQDVVIVPIPGAGSENFKKLGMSLRTGYSGPILPKLLEKYVKGVATIDSVSVCAYSAGHGLVNQLGLHPQDLAAVKAVVLDDAAFIWNDKPAPPGLAAWAAKGVKGESLFVATSSRGQGEHYRSGTASVELIWQTVAKQAGATPQPVTPNPPVTLGTWQKMGVSAYWGDIPTLTHGEHHDYAATVWQAYLAPYLAPQKAIPMSGYRSWK